MVTFDIWSEDLFACRHLLHQSCHYRNCLADRRCRVTGLHDDDIFAEHIYTRIFLVLCCQYRNAKSFFYCFTDRTTCHTVTSCVKCRPCNEYIWFVLFHHLDDRICRCVKVLSEIVISTDHSCCDLIFFTECLFQCCTWSYCAFSYFRHDICFLFSTDSGKELIDIMNNFICCHTRSSFSYRRFLVTSCRQLIETICNRRCNDDLKFCLE